MAPVSNPESDVGKVDHRGVWACLGAAFFYAVAALLVKVCSSSFSTLEVLWARGLLQLFFVSGVFAFRCVSPLGPQEIRCFLVLRGVLGVGSIFCYFLGIVF